MYIIPSYYDNVQFDILLGIDKSPTQQMSQQFGLKFHFHIIEYNFLHEIDQQKLNIHHIDDILYGIVIFSCGPLISLYVCS